MTDGLSEIAQSSNRSAEGGWAAEERGAAPADVGAPHSRIALESNRITRSPNTTRRLLVADHQTQLDEPALRREAELRNLELRAEHLLTHPEESRA